jgi:ABC-2 type transport system ATP-binding protein
MNDPALELTNVVKRYGQFTAVNDVSLSVPRGVIYGFLGPNGAGKTTTLRMILEIIRPTSGSIRVLGQSSALAVRDRIGYLPEEKGLYKKMKAWSIIAYFASLKGLSSADARRRAFELLERYGLKDFAEARTEALSKGMGQKVQVLASIAHDPDLVILDEPFSGLDPVNQEVMEEVIRDLAGRGRTVLFSTHVMQHAERLCDRLLLISQGRKIFDGTTAEAKGHVPRKVRLECNAGAESLQGFEGVIAVDPVASPGKPSEVRPTQTWELRLRENVDPQSILQACFERGLRLQRFEQVDPTLHDVFMQLVGPEGREARFR